MTKKNIENWITRKLNRSNYSAWSLPIFFLDCLQKLFWEKNLFFDREMSVNCSAPTKTNTNVVPFIGAYSLISVMISLSHFQAKSVHVTFVYTTLDTNFYSQLHQPIFFHFFMFTFIFSHLSNRCNCNLFDVCECFFMATVRVVYLFSLCAIAIQVDHRWFHAAQLFSLLFLISFFSNLFIGLSSAYCLPENCVYIHCDLSCWCCCHAHVSINTKK